MVKQVVPSTTPAGSITGATPAGGWAFAGAGSANVTVTAPTTRTTAAGTGAVNFPLTFTGGATTGPVTLTETQQSGYVLQQVGGSNAVCTRIDNGASVPVTNSGGLGFTVTAASTYPVSLHRLQPCSEPARLGGAEQDLGDQRHDRMPKAANLPGSSPPAPSTGPTSRGASCGVA